MNLVEMHDRVDFLADTLKSPRYNRKMRDNALNIAIDAFVKDRYDNIKKAQDQGHAYSFELVERVKEELYSITVIDYQSVIVNGFIPTPPNFMYHIVTFIFTEGKWVLSVPKSYVENDLSQNAFAAPSAEQPIHRRLPNGFKFDLGHASASLAHTSYIRNFQQVQWNETPIVAGTTVLIPGQTYYVVSGVAIQRSTPHIAGSVFTSTATGFVGSGVLNLINNSDLPVHTHEEICKIATSVLTGTFENYNKSEKLNQEANRS